MFNWIKLLFNKFLKKCKEFFVLALPLVKQLVIGRLKEYALEVVTTLNNTDLSNEQKRKEAFAQIKDYSKEMGIAVTDSLINLIIELAVQTFKKWD